ncbi:MAG: ABC transporter ATP-binding protein [Chloroflexi bacterium]|nr:ABC transporter ATP-binding protein [Chloroflexota bacterium]
MSDMVLEVDGIHTFIGQFHILEGVNVAVRQGEITVLLGRNGAGKTTTLRSVMGLANVRTGDIRFYGKSIRQMPAYRIAQLGIGYVPEHRAIFRDLSVAENLKIAERSPGDLARRQDFIYSIFPDLERLRHLGGGQLSGGQQQMLSVARALVPENRLLLIDEPSEGLAPVIIEQMMRAIRELSARMTILLVEQNFRMASELADRFVIIEEGQSVFSGPMSDLVGNDELINRYLGAA